MSNKYRRGLMLLISITLILGLTMPFIGHLSKGIFYRLHWLDYICYISPFVGLVICIWRFILESSENEITKAQFSGHLAGSVLYFTPYYLLGLEVRNSLSDAPQGPGILFLPLSVPITLYVVYRPIYSIVTRILQSSLEDKSSKVNSLENKRTLKEIFHKNETDPNEALKGR